MCIIPVLQHNSDTLDYGSDCPEAQGTPCQNDSEVSKVEQVREMERDVSIFYWAWNPSNVKSVSARCYREGME